MLLSVSKQPDGSVVVSAPVAQREGIPEGFESEEEAVRWLVATRAQRMVDPRLAGDLVSGTYTVTLAQRVQSGESDEKPKGEGQ